MALPSHCRVITECVLTAIGTAIGFALFVVGIYAHNYHTLIWGWFSGFCAFRVLSLQISYLRSQFHDKYSAEQLSKLKIITAYLVLGSIIAGAYYLPFAYIYNKSFSMAIVASSVETNYWWPLMACLLSTTWLTLLLYNVIIYRNYLLTENIPDLRAEETRPLLG